MFIICEYPWSILQSAIWYYIPCIAAKSLHYAHIAGFISIITYEYLYICIIWEAWKTFSCTRTPTYEMGAESLLGVQYTYTHARIANIVWIQFKVPSICIIYIFHKSLAPVVYRPYQQWFLKTSPIYCYREKLEHVRLPYQERSQPMLRWVSGFRHFIGPMTSRALYQVLPIGCWSMSFLGNHWLFSGG